MKMAACQTNFYKIFRMLIRAVLRCCCLAGCENSSHPSYSSFIFFSWDRFPHIVFMAAIHGFKLFLTLLSCSALLRCFQNLTTIHLINWFNLPYPTFQFIQERLCAFTPLARRGFVWWLLCVLQSNKVPSKSNPALILHLSVNDLTGSISHRLCINCRKKG